MLADWTMRTKTCAISFAFAPSPGTNDDQVLVLADDSDLMKMIGSDGLGVDPPEFFAQSSLLEGGDLLIGRCRCGVIGCGDVRVKVAVTDDSVLWRDINGDIYVFEHAQYSQAIAEAASSIDWESTLRRAERLVSLIDFAPVEETDYRFEWASARIGNGRIVLSFDFAGTQRLFEIDCDHQDPDDAVRNVRRWVLEFRSQ
jgi:hypothetical protein